MRKDAKQNPEENVEYNEEQFYTRMKKYKCDVNSGAQLYQKLKTFENKSFAEARTEVLKIACKVDYLNRMICKKGQLPIDKLYNEVKNEFESLEALEKFIRSMVPIFLYIPGKLNPRNTSDGYRKLVFHIASLLFKQMEVTESNINQIILSLIPENVKASSTARNTFKHHEVYLDFKGLRCLAAQVPCFNYNKQAKRIELVESPDFENSLALWIDVLRPRFSPRRDMSRRFCCNAVVTKVYDKYIKGRILGCGKLSGYGIFILSMFLEDNKAGIKGFNVPAKNFISTIGAITPDDACQITVQRFAPTVIGWKMFDVKNNWGDIKEDQMIYSPTNDDQNSTNVKKPKYPVQSSFTLPDIRTLCEDYDRDLFTKTFANAAENLGKDSVSFGNMKRKLEEQAKESQNQYKKWKKRRDRVVGEVRNSKSNNKKLLDLDPEPTTFKMNSEMSIRLDK